MAKMSRNNVRTETFVRVMLVVQTRANAYRIYCCNESVGVISGALGRGETRLEKCHTLLKREVFDVPP